VTHDSQSTPITPEGLRGLGMNKTQCPMSWWIPLPGDGRIFLDQGRDGWDVMLGIRRLGTAPDLETVGRLIEVLRRMNGGG
jgi:hypothetical protein